MALMKTVTILKLSVVAASLAMLTVFADEKDIQGEGGGKDDRTEAAIVALLKRHFPELRISKMEEDRERGERMKEVRLSAKEKEETVVVKLSESNEILEVEEELDQNEVPEHVVRALRKAFPHAEIKHAEKETRMEHKLSVPLRSTPTFSTVCLAVSLAVSS